MTGDPPPRTPPPLAEASTNFQEPTRRHHFCNPWAHPKGKHNPIHHHFMQGTYNRCMHRQWVSTA